MRIVTLVLIIASGGPAAVAYAADALAPAAPHLALARVLFIGIGAVFLAGFAWRLSHRDRPPEGPADRGAGDYSGFRQ